MAIDKQALVNEALSVELGVGPIFSTDDGSDLAEQVEQAWNVTVDRVFGLHDWHFALKTVKLNRLADTPVNGWKYAFELPGGRIGPPLKILDDPKRRRPLRDFDLEEGLLFADGANAWARCKFLVDPDTWDPAFRTAFVKALGANLAVPVWADNELKSELMQECFGTPSQGLSGGLFGRLMAQDKAAAPIGEPLLDDDPLTNVRPTGAPIDTPWHGRF